jgi:hypothetical protein
VLSAGAGEAFSLMSVFGFRRVDGATVISALTRRSGIIRRSMQSHSDKRGVRAALTKTAILALLLFAPLAQARAVHVCGMAGTVIAGDCCCGDLHQRTRRDSVSDACCFVTAELTSAPTGRTVAPKARLPGRPDHHEMPATLPVWPTDMFPARVARRPTVAFADSRCTTGRDLYLLTERLRL